MSWVEEKAREAWERIRHESPPVPQREIERAIRETIERCAEVAADDQLIACAIRELLEP